VKRPCRSGGSARPASKAEWAASSQDRAHDQSFLGARVLKITAQRLLPTNAQKGSPATLKTTEGKRRPAAGLDQREGFEQFIEVPKLLQHTRASLSCAGKKSLR